jgi:pyridoxal phosphate enzyme (YggS family)
VTQTEKRRSELADNLERLGRRVASACAQSGRRPADLTVVVVTKSFPADDVRLLAQLGVRDVGENKDQEASEKVRACADVAVRWHFVGQLQSNKARSVVTYADVVHSVDRERVVRSLDRAAHGIGRRPTALVQVALEEGPGRGGAPPDEVLGLADLVAAAEALELGGVMAVAPPGADPRAAFDRLAGIAEQVRAVHPGATIISAGMSGDLEAAIAAGATHLRVGSAVLGRRSLSR